MMIATSLYFVDASEDSEYSHKHVNLFLSGVTVTKNFALVYTMENMCEAQKLLSFQVPPSGAFFER